MTSNKKTDGPHLDKHGWILRRGKAVKHYYIQPHVQWSLCGRAQRPPRQYVTAKAEAMARQCKQCRKILDLPSGHGGECPCLGCSMERLNQDDNK
jgi:hypothetical protein